MRKEERDRDGDDQMKKKSTKLLESINFETQRKGEHMEREREREREKEREKVPHNKVGITKI